MQLLSMMFSLTGTCSPFTLLLDEDLPFSLEDDRCLLVLQLLLLDLPITLLLDLDDFFVTVELGAEGGHCCSLPQALRKASCIFGFKLMLCLLMAAFSAGICACGVGGWRTHVSQKIKSKGSMQHMINRRERADRWTAEQTDEEREGKRER
jgi:hypothetical protein